MGFSEMGSGFPRCSLTLWKRGAKGRKWPFSADLQERRPDTPRAPICYTPFAAAHILGLKPLFVFPKYISLNLWVAPCDRAFDDLNWVLASWAATPPVSWLRGCWIWTLDCYAAQGLELRSSVIFCMWAKLLAQMIFVEILRTVSG